jgi:excisionase family DNA binding protein
MEYIDIKRPTKEEQEAALASYDALASTIEHLRTENPEIEIEETKERIRIPLSALKILAQILKEISHGKPVSFVPVSAELTTQAAADLLGCSRPHVVKLLKEGRIAHTKVGKHRRIKYEDVMNYKKYMKSQQKKAITEIMELDEASGLYDS